MRVPFIAWGQGTGSPVRVQDVPIQLTDLVPTLLEMAHVPTPAEVPLEGVSLTKLLDGSATLPDRDLVWHFPAYLEGYTRLHGPWRTTPVTSNRSRSMEDARIPRGPAQTICFISNKIPQNSTISPTSGSIWSISSPHPSISGENSEMPRCHDPTASVDR